MNNKMIIINKMFNICAFQASAVISAVLNPYVNGIVIHMYYVHICEVEFIVQDIYLYFD